MGFNIFYHKDALKDLENVKNRISSDGKLILTKIEAILAFNPFPYGSTIKKLKNIQPPLYRLRVNGIVSYRIFYRIIENAIYVLKIVPKKDSDKVLRKYF